MTLSGQELVVECAIWLLWALLSYVDVVLVALSKLRKANSPTNQPRKKVVIVGASFAGLTVQRDLCFTKDLDVTVVDFKKYFEYTPGILRCFIEPSFLKHLTRPLQVLKKSGTRIITGEVVEVDATSSSGKGKNEISLKDGRKLPYDYLVLATGSTYAGHIRATAAERTMSERQLQWDLAAAKLELAQTIAIVGAGAVGVELAGEILTKYPPNGLCRKRLIMIDMAPKILTGFADASVTYATKWLEKNGVELKLGSPLKNLTEKSITFADGTTVQVDLVYKCVGAAPNTSFLENKSGLSASGPKQSVLVNDYLQVDGYPQVFCAGDACFHRKSNEVKLAHTAGMNGHLVAKNILKISKQDKSELLAYPSGVVGDDVTPKIYIISLGKYDATLGFNKLVINGFLAAVAKWLIEWTSVAAAEQRPVGVVFWAIAHAASNFLGRTILKTSTKDKKL